MSEKFTQWIFDPAKRAYLGSKPKTIESSIHPGYYKLSTDDYGAPLASQIDLRKDKLISFTEEPFTSAMKEIQKFWKSDTKYNDLGITYKRGMLLWGPPGCGKTSLIGNIINDVIARKGIAVSISNYNAISNFLNVMPLFRQIQEQTYLVVILEDLDHLIQDGAEEMLLELLDGSSSITDKILYISTTNKLNDIPARIKFRPSRIDTLIEIGYPTTKQCNEYLDFLTIKRPNLNKTLKSIIKKQKKLTFADIKEMVISTVIFESPIEDTLKKLKDCKKSYDGEELRKREEDDY